MAPATDAATLISENHCEEVVPDDLYVTVLDARVQYTNDLYVQIELEPWALTSGVVHKTKFACFNETFLVRDSRHRYAVINLMDKDTLSRDDTLGQCAVDLRHVGAVPKTCYLPMAGVSSQTTPRPNHPR